MSVRKGDKTGTLYVVATPIGNLEDWSPRARRVLGGVGRVYAEDTRRCLRLAARFKLRLRLQSCHAGNEPARAEQLPRLLRAGEDVALVSDAGSPALSDPGSLLVRAAQDAGCPVVCVPGPSALSAALSVAGLPVARFVFEGFLPPGTARKRRLRELAAEPRALVFFEAPHRLRACLRDCVAVLGEQREAALLKELSKLHERITRDALGTLCAAAAETTPRGEYVLIIQGNDAPPTPGTEQARRLCAALAGRLPRREILDITARVTGLGRNRVYQLLPHDARHRPTCDSSSGEG